MELKINVAHVERIARELGIKPMQVGATAHLFSEGGTVPFIARYRKEQTGELDEVKITAIRDRLEQLQAVDDRRSSIIKSLEERKLLTDLLSAKINAADSLTVLEDLFAPFRPKRRTRATIAKDKGLEPLADWIEANQGERSADPKLEAEKYVKPDAETDDLKVKDVTEALGGARDIIAERISDSADVRAAMRKLYQEQGTVYQQGHDGQGRGRRGSQVPRLLRLERAAQNHPFPPHARHSPRRNRRLPDDAREPARSGTHCLDRRHGHQGKLALCRPNEARCRRIATSACSAPAWRPKLAWTPRRRPTPTP